MKKDTRRAHNTVDAAPQALNIKDGFPAGKRPTKRARINREKVVEESCGVGCAPENQDREISETNEAREDLWTGADCLAQEDENGHFGQQSEEMTRTSAKQPSLEEVNICGEAKGCLVEFKGHQAQFEEVALGVT